jgi:hypothetical protein
MVDKVAALERDLASTRAENNKLQSRFSVMVRGESGIGFKTEITENPQFKKILHAASRADELARAVEVLNNIF